VALYRVRFKPKALKDLGALPDKQRKQVITKVEAMQDNLVGDVKKLTSFTSEYRLRLGRYRVLFEIEDDVIMVYRVIHRKDAYR
jgi:mRNA interferase RelE/StbE